MSQFISMSMRRKMRNTLIEKANNEIFIEKIVVKYQWWKK